MYTIERWKYLELSFQGKEDGDVYEPGKIKGIFESKDERKEVEGFYDGQGSYKIRFMPSFEGSYCYEIKGEDLVEARDRLKGTIEVIKAKAENHGPVHVSGQYHFAYEDGSVYYPIGTTCYAWTQQEDAWVQETLMNIGMSPFNKIRFCIFPKHYIYNLKEPVTYPYEGSPDTFEGMDASNFNDYLPETRENKWNFDRFNPNHFRRIEVVIETLAELGIEADIILFHPYDRWGFSTMSKEENQRYLRYVLARFSSLKNVWWSLANEYDLCKAKSSQDWEEIAQTIVSYDPYTHLRSIHNCKHMYDFTRPWVTHCSIQRTEIYESAAKTAHWRKQFKKPVVLDEVGYEGDIPFDWGNLTAQEMVYLFWITLVRGGYCGHGETYTTKGENVWWSHGKSLYGLSPERIHFMCKILKEVPGLGLKPADWEHWNENVATAEALNYEGAYFLCYLGRGRSAYKEFELDENFTYQVEVIDTWNMTIEDQGLHKGKFRIDLPAKPYMAIQIRVIENA